MERGKRLGPSVWELTGFNRTSVPLGNGRLQEESMLRKTAVPARGWEPLTSAGE